MGLFSAIYNLASSLRKGKGTDNVMEAAYAEKGKGNFEKAIALYTKVIEEGTKNWVVYFYRGECRKMAGDKTGAIADYEKAIETNKKYSGKAKQALDELKK